MRLKKGFTLIELLVVVSIIAMLTALIMVNINAVRERARDVERKSDLDQIKKALRMYYNDNNRYPETGTDNKIKACGNPATIVFNWGAQFICSGMVYMKILPQDPIQGQTYSYQQQASGQDFRLWATLENKSDGEITKSQTRCSGSWSAGQYVVCAD